MCLNQWMCGSNFGNLSLDRLSGCLGKEAGTMAKCEEVCWLGRLHRGRYVSGLKWL